MEPMKRRQKRPAPKAVPCLMVAPASNPLDTSMLLPTSDPQSGSMCPPTKASAVAVSPSTRITERGETRADDKVTEAAMEDRKKVGYF